jgi:hypothetical protein
LQFSDADGSFSLRNPALDRLGLPRRAAFGVVLIVLRSGVRPERADALLQRRDLRVDLDGRPAG